MPEDLVQEIDRIVGPRQRSRFIEEAVRLMLVNARQKEAHQALQAAAIMPDPETYPHFATPELTSRWVRDTRKQDDKRLERKLSHRSD